MRAVQGDERGEHVEQTRQGELHPNCRDAKQPRPCDLSSDGYPHDLPAGIQLSPAGIAAALAVRKARGDATGPPSEESDSEGDESEEESEEESSGSLGRSWRCFLYHCVSQALEGFQKGQSQCRDAPYTYNTMASDRGPVLHTSTYSLVGSAARSVTSEEDGGVDRARNAPFSGPFGATQVPGSVKMLEAAMRDFVADMAEEEAG